jgi:hypothetical protein
MEYKNLNNSKINIDQIKPEDRKIILKDLFNKVIFPQRHNLIKVRKITNQSAQVDSDGYIAQLIASIVLGIKGTGRHGKSGKHKGDLADGTEVKSSYRFEQKNKMEDTHVNFGAMAKDKMLEFLSHEKCVIVHTSYDKYNRIKTEILFLDLTSNNVRSKFNDFYLRSKAKKPQFQPRLYPDNIRDELYRGENSFYKLGAKVLARVIESDNGALVDIWSPEEGLNITTLEDMIDVSQPPKIENNIFDGISDLKRLDSLGIEKLAIAFFQKCFIDYRKSFLPFCKITNTTQNLGFANLSQHMVSIVTRKKGINSNARGSDLEDGSEIKLALGDKNDFLGGEDKPRLDLNATKEKILSWPELYAVRLECPNNLLKIKILAADILELRNQVKDYFSPHSAFIGDNMQYHPQSFQSDIFTGKNSKGNERKLKFNRIICIQETKEGLANLCSEKSLLEYTDI